MKRKNIYFVLAMLCLGVFIACNDNDDDMEPCDELVWYQDADGDGLGNPAVTEVACEQPDGFVSNPNDTDDTMPCDEMVWYEDADGDGLGNPDVTQISCEQPDGYVANSDDDDDSGGNAGEPIILTCSSLQATQSLSNGPNAVDYIVDCGISVTGAITVEPGTVIAFEEGTFLNVTTGSLKAKGTQDEPIIFRGMNEVSGFWNGILYKSNSNDNELEHVVIKDAGNARIECCFAPFTLEQKDGRLKISNVTLENGSSYGFGLRPEAVLSTFNNVTIKTHEEAPVVVSIDQVGALNNEGCDFSGNENDYIEVYGGSIDDAVDFRRQSVPYYLAHEGTINVNDELTIDPGVNFIMSGGTGLYIGETGSIEADGQATDKIVFRGEIESPGYWTGIYLESNNPRNTLNHIDIQHAGSARVVCCGEPASLVFRSGQAEVRNLQLTEGAGFGIIMWDGYDFNDYANVNISNHENAPITCDFSNVADLDGEDSDYTGNDINAVLISGGTISSAATMPKINVPYQIQDVVNIEAGLEIEAGTTLNFEVEGGILVRESGSLDASATASSPIIFQGTTTGVTNFWRGILIYSRNNNNKFENFVLDGAGNGTVACCNGENGIRVEGGILSINNGEIENVDGCGISYDQDADVTIENVTYTNVTSTECEE